MQPRFLLFVLGAAAALLLGARGQASAACAAYSASAATISPCTAAPKTVITITLRRAIVPKSVSFLTGVNNGIAVGGIAPVTQKGNAYTFVVPAFLCAAGSGSTYAVRLADSHGVNQGEIGRLIVDCRHAASGGGMTTAASGATIVTGLLDGDFSGAAAPGLYATYPKGSKAITGWTVIGTSVDLIGTDWNPPGGGRSLDLDGTPGPGGITQVLKTVPGKTYTVQFLFSGNEACDPKVKVMKVSAGATTARYTFDTNAYPMGTGKWLTKYFKFNAAGTSIPLTFQSDDGATDCGPVVAKIKLV